MKKKKQTNPEQRMLQLSLHWAFPKKMQGENFTKNNKFKELRKKISILSHFLQSCSNRLKEQGKK